jgi:transcriptional regulator
MITTTPVRPRDRLRGSLDVLVLTALSGTPRHGYAIARWLADNSGDALRVEEGSLYPALYRMEQAGWLASDWRQSDLGRPAKFYKLTAAGRRRLKTEREEWTLFTRAVTQVLALQA